MDVGVGSGTTPLVIVLVDGIDLADGWVLSPFMVTVVCVSAGCVVFAAKDTCVLASLETGTVYSGAGFVLEKRDASVGI